MYREKFKDINELVNDNNDLDEKIEFINEKITEYSGIRSVEKEYYKTYNKRLIRYFNKKGYIYNSKEKKLFKEQIKEETKEQTLLDMIEKQTNKSVEHEDKIYIEDNETILQADKIEPTEEDKEELLKIMMNKFNALEHDVKLMNNKINSLKAIDPQQVKEDNIKMLISNNATNTTFKIDKKVKKDLIELVGMGGELEGHKLQDLIHTALVQFISKYNSNT
ncbi:MAG: hypothetical protein R3Y64_08810 [Peptostreptococcaceae bacterium]